MARANRTNHNQLFDDEREAFFTLLETDDDTRRARRREKSRRVESNRYWHDEDTRYDN